MQQSRLDQRVSSRQKKYFSSAEKFARKSSRQDVRVSVGPWLKSPDLGRRKLSKIRSILGNVQTNFACLQVAKSHGEWRKSVYAEKYVCSSVYFGDRFLIYTHPRCGCLCRLALSQISYSSNTHTRTQHTYVPKRVQISIKPTDVCFGPLEWRKQAKKNYRLYIGEMAFFSLFLLVSRRNTDAKSRSAEGAFSICVWAYMSECVCVCVCMLRGADKDDSGGGWRRPRRRGFYGKPPRNSHIRPMSNNNKKIVCKSLALT